MSTRSSLDAVKDEERASVAGSVGTSTRTIVQGEIALDLDLHAEEASEAVLSALHVDDAPDAVVPAPEAAVPAPSQPAKPAERRASSAGTRQTINPLVSGVHAATAGRRISRNKFKTINRRPNWRYNFIETDADDPLEQSLISFPHRIKLAICVTGYNEPFTQLNDTLRAINANLDNAGAFTSGMLKPEEVLVFVVFDGMAKANPDIFTDGPKHQNTYFEARDREMMKKREDKHSVDVIRRASQVMNGTGASATEQLQMLRRASRSVLTEEGDPDMAHLWQASVQLNNTAQISYRTKMQLMFCFKVKNGGKIDSHKWFFRALAPAIDPKYCLIIDMGTNPKPDAILHLFKDMESNEQVGGCCGQIAIDVKNDMGNLCNFVIAAQVYEYKVANLLDKSLESVIGFVGVLPGAFSAYRWDAIRQIEGDPQCPLLEYFKLADLDTEAANLVHPWTANMYLAEDRILGLEILLRRNARWTLHYNEDAIAYTDCPENLAAVISQRRRWLNGSFFATVHVIKQSAVRLYNNKHSVMRKFMLTILMLYNCIQMVFTLLLLGNTYLVFLLTLRLALPSEDSEKWSTLEFGLLTLFMVVTNTQVVFSLGSNPKLVDNRKRLNRVYSASSFVYGLMFVFAQVAIWLRFSEFSAFVKMAALASFGSLYVAAALHGELTVCLATSAQFYAMMPTWLLLLPIYSFANVHDISWGNRPSHTDQEAATFKQRQEERFKHFRAHFLNTWIVVNFVYVSLILEFEITNTFAKSLVLVVAFLLAFRFFGSVTYTMFKQCKRCCPRLCRRPAQAQPQMRRQYSQILRTAASSRFHPTYELKQDVRG